MNFDEEKIRQKISEWWEEPLVPAEGNWEDVNKRSSQSQKINASAPSSKSFKSGGGRGRGAESGGGGRGRSNGRGGGRAGGREGRSGRGRGGERNAGGPMTKETNPLTEPTEDETAPTAAATPSTQEDTTPYVRPPQGAWAKKTAEPEPAVIADIEPEPVVVPPLLPQPRIVDAASAEIAPSSLPSAAVPAPGVPALASITGNVWATRGSAHLIKAEKPIPPKPIVPPAPVSRKVNGSRNSDPARNTALTLDGMHIATPVAPTHEITQVTLPSAAPLSVVVPPPVISTAAPITATRTTSSAPAINAWNQDQPDPILPSVVVSAATTTIPAPPPKPTAPTNVLNMGRWETGDTDDNLDFGFGSFGTDNTDVADPHAESTSVTAATAAASPARPPPGLSMGMPPMPANAVLVHELENKLEEVSISKQQHQQQQHQQQHHQQQQHQQHQHQHQQPVQESSTASSITGIAPTTQHQPHYAGPHGTMHDSSLISPPIYSSNPYSSVAGGMGMYGSYTSPGVAGTAIPGHAFVGMPGSGGLGVPPPKGPVQQQHLYSSAPSSGNAAGLVGAAGTGIGGAGSNDNSATLSASNTAATAMPPGMTGMPYGNPIYYGQQQFVMGQHQQGIGYNYGYAGQFAGGVQSGFGYPGGMHGNAGYGHSGPTYDDHTGAGGAATHGGVPGSGGAAGAGGYDPQQQQQQQKNSGGYRGGGGGRHNNNQYQQYNPQQQHHQHAGYGAQPYGMGYHGDHFNQRGGYQNMQDPYMQQQQQQGVGNYGGGGFQGDNQYKGKKNNRGGLNQFQHQGPPMANQNQHISGQQAFGSDTNQPSADSWTNQGSWGGTGSGWQGK
jgi:hypothetical protein